MNLKESLIFSYLKHIKKCKIIQTNWVPKTKDWNEDYYIAHELFRISKNYFKNKYRVSIFDDIVFDKDKVIAPIDAFGISFNRDYTQNIYAVIFELNEEDKKINIKDILEKIFIVAIYFASYFNKINGNIMLMYPHLDYETIKEIGIYYSDIKEIFRQVSLSFEVNILINEEFQEKVVKKLEKECFNIDEDEEEVYLKSLKLQRQLSSIIKNNIVKSDTIESDTIKKIDDLTEKTIKSNVNREVSNKIEIEVVKDLEEENEWYSESIIEESNKSQIDKLDIMIDEDIKGILFNNINNISNDEEHNTTKYYMNNRNIKTQLSVDKESITRIIEERNKKLVEDLLRNKKSQKDELNINDDIKIGELVKREFDRLFKQERIPKGEIKKLQEYDYCKKVFGINYPVLREVNMDYSLEEQRRDENGDAIYYGFILTIYDKDYYICSIWSEENRKDFLRWMSFLVND